MQHNELLKLGSIITYNGEQWTVGAVAWLGERYYFLVRPNEVAMVPAACIPSNGK